MINDGRATASSSVSVRWHNTSAGPSTWPNMMVAVLRNPLTMALWGLIVAAVLFVASLPVLIGLAVAIPVLGHATWHAYRDLVRDR